MGDSLVPGLHVARRPKDVERVAKEYDRLADQVGQPCEFIQLVRHYELNSKYLASLVNNFAGVWGWTDSDENEKFWDALHQACQKSDCRFSQTVYPDYYTSKVYPLGDRNYRILSTQEAMKLGVQKIERHYRVTQLARTQVELLQKALQRDVQIINYATWNDFPEGHHLAPEVNRGFAPSLILRHYKRKWRTGSAGVEREQAMVFFKKYRHDVIPKFNVPLVVKSKNKNLGSEDEIQIGTLLNSPADLFVNGEKLTPVKAGFRVSRAPISTGPITVQVIRQGKPVLEFTTPHVISEQPLRTDRMTYSYSTEYEREFELLFPNRP